MQSALADTADFFRIDASKKLDPKVRGRLGQYMTPAPISRFMASLFSDVSGDVRVLDPGAGVGSLTSAFAERCVRAASKIRSAALHCYEIEPALIGYLTTMLDDARSCGEAAHIDITSKIHVKDFIEACARPPRKDQLSLFRQEGEPSFTHVIMNPPYRKIHSAHPHRAALRSAGLETSNLYTGFLFLAAMQLQTAGEMVAIVPRSFCNGPYFQNFRDKFLQMMVLQHIHVFTSRDAAFKGDEVLQENIILHAVRDAAPSVVTVTTSQGADFHFDARSGECTAEDLTQRVVDYHSIIRPGDPRNVVHLAVNNLEQAIMDRMAHFKTSLSELGVQVSTGPVVDFRLRKELRAWPEGGAAPLLYPAHFRGGCLKWPKKMKKPNAIAVNAASRKWLYPNEGHFVVTRRFSSKEEKRRVVASVCPPELPGKLIGFENHLNVYHANRKGLPELLALGLSVYLNSSLVDRYFRQFSGHTQVNATDLRSLSYPARAVLERLGRKARGAQLSQPEIDRLMEQENTPMTDKEKPILAQERIDQALQIVKALGMPRAQQNERSALTLLALLGLMPDAPWTNVARPLMGITPIMNFCRDHYGTDYAPNTRETFRRQTMHQFVEAGIAVYNPDQPDRPTNSPRACYQVSEEVRGVIATFGTGTWPARLEAYLEHQGTLADKWARQRSMQMIAVDIPGGGQIKLSPGAHSELIQQVITEFAARFVLGAEVIYIGDTGNKAGYLQEQRLAELGVAMDLHGKMPDVILYSPERNWLLLIESVTSHGPVDAKRRNELAKVFANADPGIVYVTAFSDRRTMARYLGAISWETEVWCADSPTHLIHFDGKRFLGPYGLE